MTNPFDGRVANLAGPARDILPVTPNDATDLSQFCVGLYVETGGSIVMTTEPGETRTITVPDFAIIPVAARRIHATGTTATGIHGLIV